MTCMKGPTLSVNFGRSDLLLVLSLSTQFYDQGIASMPYYVNTTVAYTIRFLPVVEPI